MLSHLFLTFAMAATCQTYSVSCDCGPSTPFEGFQVYVVEKCDGKEEWFPHYGESQFDTLEQCQQSIPANKTCRNLKFR